MEEVAIDICLIKDRGEEVLTHESIIVTVATEPKGVRPSL